MALADKCLVCWKNLPMQTLFSLDEVEVNNKEADCDTVKPQLHVIFTLRKVLEIPEELCCQFLQDFGDPYLWIDCCTSCSAELKEARSVFNKIIALQNQFIEIQSKIKKAIAVSVNLVEAVNNECKPRPKEIVRSFVHQEFGNFSSATPDDIKMEIIEYSDNSGLGLDHTLSLSNDLDNEFSEIEDEDEEVQPSRNCLNERDEKYEVKESQFAFQIGERRSVTENIADMTRIKTVERSCKRNNKFKESVKPKMLRTHLEDKDKTRNKKTTKFKTIITDGKKRYVCEICDNNYRQWKGLWQHMKKHGPPGFYCDECGTGNTRSEGARNCCRKIKLSRNVRK